MFHPVLYLFHPVSHSSITLFHLVPPLSHLVSICCSFLRVLPLFHSVPIPFLPVPHASITLSHLVPPCSTSLSPCVTLFHLRFTVFLRVPPRSNPAPSCSPLLQCCSTLFHLLPNLFHCSTFVLACYFVLRLSSTHFQIHFILFHHSSTALFPFDQPPSHPVSLFHFRFTIFLRVPLLFHPVSPFFNFFITIPSYSTRVPLFFPPFHIVSPCSTLFHPLIPSCLTHTTLFHPFPIVPFRSTLLHHALLSFVLFHSIPQKGMRDGKGDGKCKRWI